MRSIIKSGLGCFSIALNITLLFALLADVAVEWDEAAVFVPPRRRRIHPPRSSYSDPRPGTVVFQEELPTPAPPCTDSLRYVEDLSIPDGSQVSPSEKLDKRWTVENDGSCNWDQNYSLKLIAGPDMGALLISPIPARSGSQATIRIIFTAPMNLAYTAAPGRLTTLLGSLLAIQSSSRCRWANDKINQVGAKQGY
jgi:hypothetical protein